MMTHPGQCARGEVKSTIQVAEDNMIQMEENMEGTTYPHITWEETNRKWSEATYSNTQEER